MFKLILGFLSLEIQKKRDTEIEKDVRSGRGGGGAGGGGTAACEVNTKPGSSGVLRVHCKSLALTFQPVT